jgi:hypothetical protein
LISSQNLSIKTQNSSKRNIEELNFEADDDNGKYLFGFNDAYFHFFLFMLIYIFFLF